MSLSRPNIWSNRPDVFQAYKKKTDSEENEKSESIENQDRELQEEPEVLPISPVEEKEVQIKEMNKKLKHLEEQVKKYRFNEGISHQNEG